MGGSRGTHRGGGLVTHADVVGLVQVSGAWSRNLAGKATGSSSQVSLEQFMV